MAKYAGHLAAISTLQPIYRHNVAAYRLFIYLKYLQILRESLSGRKDVFDGDYRLDGV